MKDKVAVLYICTGRYKVFWKDFYKSCEKYFLPECDKQYFVFTDAEHLFAETNKNVIKIFQGKVAFPLGSLLRFQMFNKIKEQLSSFDYLFFYNSNIIFNKQIQAPEILPVTVSSGLVGYLHAVFYDKTPDTFIYERNPASEAYIPQGEGKYYFQGCLIGGKTKSFLQMSEELDTKIQRDLQNNFIAIWWDESHLNKYLLGKEVKILHPGFAYPEHFKIPFEKKAIMIDKSKFGLDFLRGVGKLTTKDKLKFAAKNILYKLKSFI